MREYIASTRWFDDLIYLIIFANIVFMATYTSVPKDAFSSSRFVVDVVITVIFAFEAVIRIYAWGWQMYIWDRWNLFDFVIVVLSSAMLALSLIFPQFPQGIFVIMKIIR